MCALVNNMPDAAFGATERQFRGLLTAGAGVKRSFCRYTMEGVPRGERTGPYSRGVPAPGRHHLGPPDLLMVTGSEPLASRSRTNLTGAIPAAC